MQVAFSGKSRYGSVYRKAVKGHRITYEQPEVPKMTLFIDLLYLALLTPVASPNPLLYQSLPISIHDRHAIGRRRKDDTHVGTAARGIVA